MRSHPHPCFQNIHLWWSLEMFRSKCDPVQSGGVQPRAAPTAISAIEGGPTESQPSPEHGILPDLSNCPAK